MTVQNVIGSVPVTNVQPPPEGPMAASADFMLSAASPRVGATFQLSAQSGFLLSQVTTLSIDNSSNGYPIQVTHGALDEVVQVAAFATSIVPTFSTRGPYAIAVSTLGNVPPTVNMLVNVVFLNYPRQAGTFSATSQSTIAATGQNTTSIFSGVGFVGGAGNVLLLAAGNYVIDSLDLGVEGVVPTASGSCTSVYSVSCAGVAFATGFSMANITAGVWNAGAGINIPIERTWPQGLILPRGGAISLDVSSVSNLTSAYMRLNISGLNTP